jgi:hypothetical protein
LLDGGAGTRGDDEHDAHYFYRQAGDRTEDGSEKGEDGVALGLGGCGRVVLRHFAVADRGQGRVDFIDKEKELHNRNTRDMYDE